MPFIRGRYHINAVAGEALEAAREAEAALLALKHDTEQDDEGTISVTAIQQERGRDRFIG